jgi:hypothetical protein
MKTQKADKFGRPLWTVILKNGQRFAASGNPEEIRASFNNDGTIDDSRPTARLRGTDTRVSQIRAKY